MRRSMPALLVALLLALPATAGEVRDFEARLRAAYGDYRAALFATNTGGNAESAAALDRFTKAWSAIAAMPAPPQYVDDAAFPDTMKKVTAIAESASAQVAGGDLAKAHDTLEGIRDEIGDLHLRNDIYSFSDRMNAYHARMEKVLGMDAADTAAVREEAAVLEYLLSDIKAHPPKEADGNFEALLGAVETSVAKLRGAATNNDAAATKAAIGGLKAPYSKFFLTFG